MTWLNKVLIDWADSGVEGCYFWGLWMERVGLKVRFMVVLLIVIAMMALGNLISIFFFLFFW